MKRIITVLVVAVLLAFIVPTGLGCTGTPSEFEVSGNWQAVMGAKEVTWVTEYPGWGGVPGPWECYTTDAYTYEGPFEGTSVIGYSTVIQEDYSFTGEGEETFTGKVDGKEGTLFLNFTQKDAYDICSAGSHCYRATYTIISGTGELAKLRGTLEIEAIKKMNLWRGTYSGTCWFEK
jgi:hypothetical protein